MPGDCQRLDWDSELFGFRVARMSSTAPSEDELRAALRWCEEREVRCLYFLCDADAVASACFACRSGFDPVDVRITLAHPGSGERVAPDPRPTARHRTATAEGPRSTPGSGRSELRRHAVLRRRALPTRQGQRSVPEMGRARPADGRAHSDSRRNRAPPRRVRVRAARNGWRGMGRSRSGSRGVPRPGYRPGAGGYAPGLVRPARRIADDGRHPGTQHCGPPTLREPWLSHGRRPALVPPMVRVT